MAFGGFIPGFAVGFVSGVAFRSLAERDFVPVKDIFKTSLGIGQKIGDAFAETYGRIIENVEDLRSQLRAERARKKPSKRAAGAEVQMKTKKRRAKGKGPVLRQVREMNA